MELALDNSVANAALSICLDVYRTLAVLKQTRQTLAFACLELAARFLEKDVEKIQDTRLYEKLGVRAEVMGK